MKKILTPGGIVRRLKRGYLNLQKKKEMEASLGIGVSVTGVPFPYYPQQPKEEELQEEEGYEIPTGPGMMAVLPPSVGERKEELMRIMLKYPLIPAQPRQGERVFAYAQIQYDKKIGGLVYYAVEPQLNALDKEIMDKTLTELEEALDIDFIKVGEVRAKNLLKDKIDEILTKLEVLDTVRRENISYHIQKEILGMGKIEALMRDPNIEDISCDGIGIPIYVYYRDPRIGSLMTNIYFENKDELDTFIVKLAQRSEKTISIAEPLLDASLPDGSRVQATLGTDIARKGSNFTIRKFTQRPLTPTHMMKFNTIDSTQLAYLWLAIDNGMSVLISGGTATGKTSLLNALSLFIRPSMKIVSIEDTPELRLPHPHWIPHVARTPLSIKGKVGEVSLFDLLKSSLRQRPDYIIMGEVRGKEAFVLFQQMATGHPSIATIHAASLPQLMDRLTTPPINLPPSLIENVNVVAFLSLSRIEENRVRRVKELMEITGIKDDKPLTKKVFNWESKGDKFATVDKSSVLRTVAERQGMSESQIKDEIKRRKKILEWLLEKDIFDYREVGKIISTYYSNPERIANLINSS